MVHPLRMPHFYVYAEAWSAPYKSADGTHVVEVSYINEDTLKSFVFANAALVHFNNLVAKAVGRGATIKHRRGFNDLNEPVIELKMSPSTGNVTLSLPHVELMMSNGEKLDIRISCEQPVPVTLGGYRRTVATR